MPRLLVAVGLTFATLHAYSAGAEPVRFNRDVRPILSDNCFVCHGPDSNKRAARLRLDLREEATKPARSGKRPIVAGQPLASELVARIFASDDDLMPPPESRKKLSVAQKKLLKQWIAEGAEYEPHWAFVPPRKAEPPAVKQSQWPRNAVDGFVLARLEAEGLQPSPEAEPLTLLRRVTLDLTGLPPTPVEMDAFINDTAPGAYERVVDRLLSTRAYAERRAQDWLDLARYADSTGFAADMPQDIWPYRDWVIEAYAKNMPFDQFTIEQLAGDMLPRATIEQRIASAFHRNAPQGKGNTYPVEEYRVKGVVDRVNTTGAVWLGLTLGCVECHDHKFDPISQTEYYRVFALFNNIVHTGKQFTQGGPTLTLTSPEQAARLVSLHDKLEPLKKEFADFQTKLGNDAAKTDAAAKRVKGELDRLNKEVAAVERQRPQVPVMEELPEPRETFVHLRGNFLARGAKVTPGAPAALGLREQPANRLEFARSLVGGRNPLTARVHVNRIWQGHFGHGLVRTPMDFGLQGEWPTHPELLDWLACTFVESGWDEKFLHRLLVTSSVYRQSTKLTLQLADRDPANRLLARMSRLRLPAEQIRDQALFAAGLLIPSNGGRPVFPLQPSKYWEDRALPGKWTNSPGFDGHRRSLYTYWRRMALHPTMEILDAPARTVCTAQRTTAIVPTQALVTLNDPIYLEAANAIARRVMDEPDERRLDRLFRICLGRGPDADEVHRFEQHTSRGDAWPEIAAVLLNLDETLARP